MMKITDAARKELLALLQKNSGKLLRIAVQGFG